MSEVILYPGSFNPAHNGHTAVAQFVADSGLCEELWMLVSPQNPLKKTFGLALEQDRLVMTEIAVAEKITVRNVKVSDFEFGLPRPSYTVETLRRLEEKYPHLKFSLLVGTDIIPQIHRWHESKYLLENYRIYVYPRKGADFEKLSAGMTYLGHAPKIEVSSTEIRLRLEQGESLSGIVAPGVVTYIYDKGLWVADAAKRRLDRLDAEIGGISEDPSLYYERGTLNYKFGQYGKALNDFLKVEQLEPSDIRAKEYIRLLHDIFEYRYTDIYNP